MAVAMDSVQKYGGICEATICYSGDILDPARTKYTLGLLSSNGAEA